MEKPWNLSAMMKMKMDNEKKKKREKEGGGGLVFRERKIMVVMRVGVFFRLKGRVMSVIFLFFRNSLALCVRLFFYLKIYE